MSGFHAIAERHVPEGHLLHHHARRQREGLVGARVVSSPQGRFDAGAVGGQLTSVEVHGKHLAHVWTDAVVHVHLGMRGLFLEGPPPAPAPRPQVRMRVEGPGLVTDLVAPMVCELTDEAGWAAVLAELGPDPLAEHTDRDAVLGELARTNRPVGVALLDQSLVAGVGNALRADVLNLVGVHPATPASALSEPQLVELWNVLVAVMRRSAEDGRIEHTVYRRERCSRCGTAVVTGELAGRRTYVCPRHQPRP